MQGVTLFEGIEVILPYVVMFSVTAALGFLIGLRSQRSRIKGLKHRLAKLNRELRNYRFEK
jgi:fructose-specific phosphotransferase system IIC component